MKFNNNISKTMIAVMVSLSLSACGGGGGSDAPSSNTGGSTPVQNQAPTLSVGTSSIELESGQTAFVSISSNDDGGAPEITLSSSSAGLSATLVDGGKTLKIVAGDVQSTEASSITVTATEQAASKLQASKTVTVEVHPKVMAFAYINESEKVTALNVQYNKPLRFRLIDDEGNGFGITKAESTDRTVFVPAPPVSDFIELSALKSGSGELRVSGVSQKTGQKFVKTFAVQAVGNQQPALTVLPNTLTLQEQTSTKLSFTITDPDGSALTLGNMSVSVSDPSVVNALVQDGVLQVNALKTGAATIHLTLVDGEHTVNASVSLSVTPEAPAVMVINQNALMEIEESSTVSFPLSLTGARADSYTITATSTPDGFSGADSDVLSVAVNDRTLVLTAKAFSTPPAGDRLTFSVKATATDGKKTVESFPVKVDVLVRSNGAPVFEMPNKLGKFVMLPKDGRSVVTITVNDDLPGNVKISAPVEFYNQSETGVYVAGYDDATRQLTLDLTGYKTNETFALLIPYQDGRMGGRFATYFRTYELSDLDRDMLDSRKTAIATVEAARAYTLIGKLYAEYLERMGLVDGQFVDEFVDQLMVDDRKWGSIINAEGQIDQVINRVYNNEYNTDSASAAISKEQLISSARSAHNFGATMITEINALAKKSNGALPELTHEATFTEVSPLRFSKFVGNTVYGKFENGVWVYHPAYKFLAAIDAKVFENTAARLK